jgi:hypothetical protein
MEIVNAAGRRHHRQMERLGEFLGLKSVAYLDLGHGENYVLTREDGQELTLRIRANHTQGGFLSIDVPIGIIPRNA